MKVLIVLAAALAICSAAGETTTFKCPQTYTLPTKPIVLAQFHGNWFITRTTPCEHDHEETDGHDHKQPDCVTKFIWRAKDTPEGEFNVVFSARKSNGTYFYKQGVGKAKASGAPGQFESQLEWDFKSEEKKNKTITAVFVETDEGQSWGIGHTCIVDEKSGNATSKWTLYSRSQKMDPKLEFELAEKMVKYSGLTHDKILGVGQTGCYDLPKK